LTVAAYSSGGVCGIFEVCVACGVIKCGGHRVDWGEGGCGGGRAPAFGSLRCTELVPCCRGGGFLAEDEFLGSVGLFGTGYGDSQTLIIAGSAFASGGGLSCFSESIHAFGIGSGTAGVFAANDA